MRCAGIPTASPSHFDNGKKLSVDLSKYFHQENLLPTGDHKVYSLRHSFKDRLKDIDAPEELIDELTGHKIGKPKYGDGYGLIKKAEFIQKIAFTAKEILQWRRLEQRRFV